MAVDKVARFGPFSHDAETTLIIGPQRYGNATKLDGVEEDLDATFVGPHDGIRELAMRRNVRPEAWDERVLAEKRRGGG
ncbi:hypothetical protein IX54_04135 [Paracoccus sanguinis]|uniref:Uncharacterized protein n=1 Tax=Paracoccus sanguinis TaxID=1545044 RepID=A0A099GLS5_9RHOB|nr:hypothetical protein IX54_04135 [Paracoccus sanguinis]KGJ23799.1 hypothetical protein IX56_00575 [Paracoccus sanguinis]